MFAENIFKDKIVCNDYSRSILKWKNEEDIVSDPKGEKHGYCFALRYVLIRKNYIEEKIFYKTSSSLSYFLCVIIFT
jgi:hypothetical protein